MPARATRLSTEPLLPQSPSVVPTVRRRNRNFTLDICRTVLVPYDNCSVRWFRRTLAEAVLRTRFEINIDYRDRLAADELVKSTPQEDRYRLGRQSVAEIVRNLLVGYLEAVKVNPELRSQTAVPCPPQKPAAPPAAKQGNGAVANVEEKE
jgi:hypothetical protein